MESEGIGPPKLRVPGLERKLAVINVAFISRLCKYFFLLVGLIVTLLVVFDAFSYYVARRDLDSELRSKKISLEYLNLLSQRERALALTTLEGRCLERTQLTMFRLFDAQHDQIKAVFKKLIEKTNQMVDTIKKLGPNLIDVDEAVKFIDGTPFFTLVKLDEYLKPLNEEIGKSDNYQKLRDTLTAQTNEYVAVANENAALRPELEQSIKTTYKELDAVKYWNMDAIRSLVDRIDQLREEHKRNKEKLSDVDDLIARYGVWVGALTGGAADNPVWDFVAFQMGTADTALLKTLDCDKFRDYYAAVSGRALRAEPMLGEPWGNLTWAQAFGIIPRVYHQHLLFFFQQPPAAQTLVVTLFLGALGALTLNVLRMSHVGWWSAQSDPLWGEIIVSPLIGSLAAFGIFLIGSAGLLLTGDNNGAQPLSAYFIGLLGFLSGLMYDEAFGRVRRVGTQMFAGKPEEDAINARAEDRSLAETLRGNGASLAAGLVLKYGIGTRVSLESKFTLLIPSDEAMGRLALTTWTKLNDPESDAFEKWYNRHHAAQRITRKDVSGDGTTAPISELHVDDGTSYGLALNGGHFKINNIRVLIADVIWNKGVIHILSADLP